MFELLQNSNFDAENKENDQNFQNNLLPPVHSEIYINSNNILSLENDTINVNELIFELENTDGDL